MNRCAMSIAPIKSATLIQLYFDSISVIFLFVPKPMVLRMEGRTMQKDSIFSTDGYRANGLGLKAWFFSSVLC